MRCIFLLSHMRGRTSVLSHILGNNKEIVGHKELHRRYYGYGSLLRMRNDLLSGEMIDSENPYYYDKVLHGYYFSSSLIKKENSKILFMIREPESTIRSTVAMGHATGKKWYTQVELVVKYYCSRLRQLEQVARTLKGKYFYIGSDDLIERPDELLGHLSVWLQLTVPLKKEYDVYGDTGHIGAGDFSENIKLGVLKATERRPKIVIPDRLLEKSSSAYQRCKKNLQNGIVL